MATTPDASGNGFDGTLSGSPLPVSVSSPWTGFGDAFSFAGTGGCGIDCGAWDAGGVPAISGVGVAAAFTLEARIERASTSDFGGICGWGSAVDLPLQLWGDLRGDLWFFWNDNTGAGHNLFAAAVLGDLLPHKVAADYDGTTMRLYVDGAVVASASTTGLAAYASGDHFWIGSDDNPFPLAAVIDEVRWSNVARHAGAYTPGGVPFSTDSHTIALYHFEAAGPPPPPPPPPPSGGIDVSIYDGADPSTLLGTLEASFQRRWRDPVNDVGAGSFSIPAREADGAISADALLCQPDRIVRFSIDGTVRYGIVIGPRDRAAIDASEEAAQNTTVTGAGVISLLGNAILLPELGVGRLSPASRLFNFASHYFDDSSWSAAVEIKAASDVVMAQWQLADGTPAPASWPDAGAWWIWSRAQVAGPPPQPIGDSYFRTSFTLADLTSCAIFITADDGYELYLDDALVASETTAFMWAQTKRVDVFLDAGTHQLAIKGTNIDRTPNNATNVAGVLCSVMESTQGGDSLGSVIVHTDSSWKADDYPATAPTMTAGQILKICIDEAQALGFLPGITYDFTATHDSKGNAWSTPVDVGFNVGTTVLDVVRSLVGLAIDVFMDPATLVLSAFNAGTYGSTPGITLEAGTHLTSLVHQADPVLVTDVLAQYHTGVWVLKTSGASPKKAAYLSLGSSPSDAQVDRSVAAVFASSGVPAVHLTWDCLPIAGATPYIDFKAGDTVTAPGVDDSPTPTRVVALLVSEPAPAQDGVVGGTTLYSAEATQ